MSAELYWSRENDSGNYLARNHTLFGVTMESTSISEFNLDPSPARQDSIRRKLFPVLSYVLDILTGVVYSW